MLVAFGTMYICQSVTVIQKWESPDSELYQGMTMYAIIGASGVLPTTIFESLPFFVFIILLGEICSSLAAWGHELVRQARNLRLFKGDPDSLSDFFSNCSRFISTLNKSSDLFRYHMFILTTFLLFGIISSSYRLVAFFIGNQILIFNQ